MGRRLVTWLAPPGRRGRGPAAVPAAVPVLPLALQAFGHPPAILLRAYCQRRLTCPLPIALPRALRTRQPEAEL